MTTRGEAAVAAGKRHQRAWPTVIACLVFVAGFALFLWRPVSNWVTQREMDAQISELESAVGAQQDESSSPAVASSGYNSAGSTADTSLSDGAADASKSDETHQRFEAYNERVRAGQAGTINDPFTTADEAGLGLETEQGSLIGSISIPKMGCNLPLYFGASEENMAKGAGVVTGTSLPIGGADSNCVVAAHRGWTTAAMFRDIEDLEVGDDVYVTNFWETLHYRVAEVAVVDPNDAGACGVQPGRDLLTLLTCHPYGVHPSPSRMLVYCERVADEAAASSVDKAPVSPQKAVPTQTTSPASEAPTFEPSALLKLEAALYVAGGVMLLAFALWLVAHGIRSRRGKTRGRHVRK